MSATQTAEPTPASHIPPGAGKSTNGKSAGRPRAASPRVRRAAKPPEAQAAEPAKTIHEPKRAQSNAARALAKDAMVQHPLAPGLFQTFPGVGATWSIEEAKSWLDLAAASIKLICKFPGNLNVTATPA